MKHNNVIFYHKKSGANELLCKILILALPLANCLLNCSALPGEGKPCPVAVVMSAGSRGSKV